MTSRLFITCCCIFTTNFAASALANAQTVDSIPDEAAQKVIERLAIASYRLDVDVHEVSCSVSVLSEKTLSENGIDDFQSALRLIPDVTLSQQRKNRATINIRGINTDIGETQLTQDPEGLYVNSMLVTGPYAEIFQPDLSLFDVNRVEVLRDSQGTLCGSGNIAGTMRIVTNQPKFDVLESSVRLDIADIAHGGVRRRQDLMVNIPLVSDELALRLVGSRRQSDGWDPKEGKFLRSTFVRESRAFEMQIYNLNLAYQFVNTSWQDGKIVGISDRRSFLCGALKNDRLPGAAEFVASAGIDVTLLWPADAQMAFSLNENHTDSNVNRFSNMSGVTAPNPDFAESEGFYHVNSAISYLRDQWNLNLYVENLLDNYAIIHNTGATNENPAISLRPHS